MAKHKVDITGVVTSNLPILSAEETKELLIKLKNGDLSAKERIILGNLKLVLSIVNKFAKRVDNLDDLFQIGVIGLIKAIDNFELEIDVRFSTYAVPMILGEIKRYLRDNSFLRISRQIKDRGYRALKEKEDFIQKNQREPSIEELSKIMDMKPYDIFECLDAMNCVSSFNDPLYSDNNESLDLMDVVPVEADNVNKLNNMLSLKEGLKSLSEFELEVLYRRYYADMTQLEIANDFDISQAQVSRIEKNALVRLKKYFR